MVIEQLTEIVGESECVETMIQFARHAPSLLGPILFSGEYGTGKELLARVIHHITPKDRGYFIKIACPRLLHSIELDHALRTAVLLFASGRSSLPLESTKRLIRDQGVTISYDLQTRYRHQGNRLITFYFEEVGFLDPEFQNTLYYWLTSNDYGAWFDFRYRVRIICATTSSLGSKVEVGQFSERLYSELNRFTLELKPLRERPMDIPVLALRFLDTYAKKYHLAITGISEVTLQFLSQYTWPGNVAELKSALEKACSQAAFTGRVLRLETLVDLLRQSQRIDLPAEPY